MNDAEHNRKSRSASQLGFLLSRGLFPVLRPAAFLRSGDSFARRFTQLTFARRFCGGRGNDGRLGAASAEKGANLCDLLVDAFALKFESFQRRA